MAGEPYDGGGIRVTTDATRAAGRRSPAAASLAGQATGQEVHRAGTTTVEIKSGYGLSVESEAETGLARRRGHTRRATFMGAHVVPTEYLGSEPTSTSTWCADRCSKAVRPHVFAGSTRSARAGHSTPTNRGRSSRRAESAGLGPAPSRQPAWTTGPGSGSGWRLGCASVDHCTYLSDDDIEALAASDTVATFLPAADFSTRQPYPDARRAIDAGVTVAIASNCNPGSSYTTSHLVLHRAGGA